jgi:hypothetical protein
MNRKCRENTGVSPGVFCPRTDSEPDPAHLEHLRSSKEQESLFDLVPSSDGTRHILLDTEGKSPLDWPASTEALGIEAGATRLRNLARGDNGVKSRGAQAQ